MRDTKKEGAGHDASVEKADGKVATQEKLVASMKPDDPRVAEAQRLLNEMRQNAAAAETIRSMFRHEQDEG